MTAIAMVAAARVVAGSPIVLRGRRRRARRVGAACRCAGGGAAGAGIALGARIVARSSLAAVAQLRSLRWRRLLVAALRACAPHGRVRALPTWRSRSGAGTSPFGKSRFHQATRASKRRTTWASRAASLCDPALALSRRDPVVGGAQLGGGSISLRT